MRAWVRGDPACTPALLKYGPIRGASIVHLSAQAVMPDAEGKGDARDGRLSGPMTLRHRDRAHVIKQLSAEALEKCHETRAAYVECAKGGFSLIAHIHTARIRLFACPMAPPGRTLSLPFMCRTVFKDFNACLGQ